MMVKLSPTIRKMKAFPNPVRDLLNVQFDIPATGEVTLEVMDVLGRTVLNSNFGDLNEGAHQQELSVNNIADGTYVLVLRLDGQLIKTQNIVVR